MPTLSRGPAVAAFLLAALSLATRAVAQQPLPNDQQADQAVAAAQQAFNAGDHNTAAAKFGEVVQKFNGTRGATAARFGLGVIQLQSENPDFAKAVEWLSPPAGDGGFPDRGQALYLLAVSQRSLGLKELDKAAANPNDAAKARQEADRRLNECSGTFRTAMDWYAGQKQDDLAGRCRCDLAEAQIRANKPKEARSTAEPFTKDAAFAKNKFRTLGLYYHGLACFLDKDANAAGRSLNQLAPFNDPAFGLHARYLIGRVLHLSGETAEASVHYDAVLADFEKARLAAVEAVKQPQNYKGNPFELARLRAVAGGPPPEYIGGSAFHLACLKYEAGKFGEAQEKFQAFVKAFPKDSLLPDAALRTGFCQVQSKQNDEAIKTLAPLVEKAPRLADQALFWVGKAQLAVAAGIDNNPADREKKAKDALDAIRKAADRANQMAGQGDADAKARRQDMLFELADGLAAFKQPKEAVPILDGLWNDQQALPARREELLQRIVAATGAAADYQRSDDRIAEFRRLYPQGTLTAAVLFRGAENAYARAVEFAKTAPANQADEVKKRYVETAVKFKEVAEKHPEYDRANHARLAAAVCLSQTGGLDDAAKLLEAIPGPDRGGELALAAYLLADILVRQTPTTVGNDALEENKAREKLAAAAGMFDAFASGNPKAAEAPAALLKLGYCQKRLAATLADPNERNQTFQKAREALEKLEKTYPKDPLVGTATLEKAKVKAMQGDRGGAMNDLRGFLNGDATKGAPAAPLAAVHLATLLREQNQPAEAVKVMEEARKRYDGDLAKDAERAEWLHLLKYQHGVALMESQKPADARKLFDEVIAAAQGKPIAAESALRAGQCRLAEGRKQIQDGVTARNQAGNDQNRKNQAQQVVQQGMGAMMEGADGLCRRSEEMRQALPGNDARARMLYDAAWAYRELSVDDIAAATEQARKEAQAKLPAGSPPPDVPRFKVPLTRFETRAFETYKRLVEEFGDTALSVDARLEHAELLAERESHTEVIALLKDALDKEPADRPVPPDTTDRIRLRLGGSLYAKKEYAAAAAQFDAAAANDKSPHRPQALYRAGEAFAAAGEHAKAVEKLLPFRAKPEYQNVGGVTDRALVRLGLSQVAAGKFDDAKGTLENFLGRFGNSPLAADARYGLGTAQQMKGQPDEAVKSFEAVIAATKAEVAARAQAQIGQCRLTQKKYADAAAAFLLVGHAYDYPEVSHAAVLEAARAHELDNKPAEAEKLLDQLTKDTPADSAWHKAAKERLGKLKK